MPYLLIPALFFNLNKQATHTCFYTLKAYIANEKGCNVKTACNSREFNINFDKKWQHRDDLGQGLSLLW